MSEYFGGDNFPADAIHAVRYVENIEKNDAFARGGQPGLKSTELFIVWFNFTLGNWKALVSTHSDKVPPGTYWEVTFNKEKNETYVDTYRKVSNRVIPGI